jgi:hypothetical protein
MHMRPVDNFLMPRILCLTDYSSWIQRDSDLAVHTLESQEKLSDLPGSNRRPQDDFIQLQSRALPTELRSVYQESIIVHCGKDMAQCHN